MRLPLGRWQLLVLALLIGTLRDPAAHAGVILAPGDMVAGGGKNVVRIDPNSGAVRPHERPVQGAAA